MAYVIMVPGLAVRGYLAPSADALRAAGHTVELVHPIGWREEGTDLPRYARRIAEHARARGPADLLIGLSVGTQSAALAARDGAARRLLLVSPTIEPGRRSTAAALRAWLGGENHPNSPRLRVQARDWVRAGPRDIYGALQSALAVRLEEQLPRLARTTDIPVTIVHAEADQLSPLPFAAELADGAQARLLVMPDAPHSWPIQDADRFIELVDGLLAQAC
jgi:pimeloyl-ACP methyl ester carboxylesterase